MAQTYLGMINLQDILGWAKPLATAGLQVDVGATDVDFNLGSGEWDPRMSIHKSLGYIATSEAKHSRILSAAILGCVSNHQDRIGNCFLQDS